MDVDGIVAGRFSLESRAGAGGMGTVYRAYDMQEKRPVAVKLLQQAKDSMVHQRFTREAEALSGALRTIDHPGVVRYVAHGTTATGHPYLVMEWLDGCNLETYINRRPLTESEALALGQRICEALTIVHRCGIIHRDIKPSNLFLVGGELSQIKLIDFGLVRMMDGFTTLTLTGGFVGTPSYVSPEQARGRVSVDERTDLYSLGAVLYACLTQEPPFVGEHMLAVATKLLLQPAPRVRASRPEVSQALDDLLSRLLSKMPARRPSSAEELGAQLRTIAQASTVVRKKPPGQDTISNNEQRFASVLVITGSLPRTTRGQLDSLASNFEASLDRIDESTAVFMFTAEHGPREAAVRAARCALAMRASRPNMAMALTTGRRVAGSQISQDQLVSEALQRAIDMLFAKDDPLSRIGLPGVSSPSGHPSATKIAIDEVTAGLLGAGFEVRRGTRSLLIAERETEVDTVACIGRSSELALVEGVARDCMSQKAPQIALVIGSEGVGKSRLLRELGKRLSQYRPEGGQAPALWTARGDSLRASSPLSLVAELVASVLGFVPAATDQAESHAQIRARIAERLRESAQTKIPGQEGALPAEHIAAFVAHIAGLPLPEGGKGQAMSGLQIHEQMLRSWIAWLAAETSRGPVILLLDDFQWADSASIRFLGTALGTLTGSPLCVLAFARPELDETFSSLWVEHACKRVELLPLSEGASVELLSLLLGPEREKDAGLGSDKPGSDKKTASASDGERIRRPSIAALAAKAGGNPFLLQELSRSYGGGSAAPDSALAMAAAAIGKRSPKERRLLRAASVFGEAFWVGGVATLLGQPAHEVHALCEALAEASLVVRADQSRVQGEDEYRTAKDLVREAAYAMLTEEDRLIAHSGAGTWLEAAGERDPLILARHYERAGMREQAEAWYLRAAEHALHRADSAENEPRR